MTEPTIHTVGNHSETWCNPPLEMSKYFILPELNQTLNLKVAKGICVNIVSVAVLQGNDGAHTVRGTRLECASRINFQSKALFYYPGWRSWNFRCESCDRTNEHAPDLH